MFLTWKTIYNYILNLQFWFDFLNCNRSEKKSQKINNFHYYESCKTEPVKESSMPYNVNSVKGIL